ncbi:MAG TPA: M15 family metallopeptidase [Nannocystaceae bacterium]|nr:M15 family metallopeptidase [Nannocystaceae bacterium]
MNELAPIDLLRWCGRWALAVTLGCASSDDGAAADSGDGSSSSLTTGAIATSTGTTGDDADDDATSAALTTAATSDADTTATGEPPCAPDPEIPESSDDAVCPPHGTTAERIGACLCELMPAVMSPAVRPLDASDPLYYVNRWYSIDPCFPYAPDDALLAEIRATYINQVGDLEPELEVQCGRYDDDLVDVPPGLTDDDDRLRALAWDSPAPADYPTTIAGEPVGLEDRIGFGPMFAAAQQEAGISLYVVSGFRDLARQAELFTEYAEAEGDPAIASVYSAWPSHSEHQLGTTADVGYVDDGVPIDPFAGLEVDLHWSPAFQWIRANAHRFGIVTTYQPDRVHVHQYKPEPWHLRFVGVEAADVMYTCELATEELLAFRYGVEPLPEYADIDLVYDAAIAGGWTPATCENAP